MKIIKNSILFSFLLIQLNFTQSLTGLYRNFISDSVLSNKNILNSLEINLQRNSKLNPDLIYYTIESYNNYNDTLLLPKLLDDLKSNERFWLIKRSDWAKHTLSKINEIGSDEWTFLSSGLFKKLFIQIIPKQNDADIVSSMREFEQQSFYSMIFYNNDSTMLFDKNMNYENLKMQTRNKIKNRIENFSFFENQNFTNEEFLLSIINNWYLLYEDQDLAYEIIAEYFNNKKLNENRKRLSIYFNSVYANNGIGSIPDLKNTWGSEKSVMDESESIYQLSLGVGYKIYFNKRTFPFSYLDVIGFYAFGISDAILNSYGIKLSFPIFHHDVFNVELSSIFSQNEYSYKPFKIKYTKEKFYVIPMLDASIDIYKGFGTEFSFGFNYGSINIYYNTSFL